MITGVDLYVCVQKAAGGIKKVTSRYLLVTYA